MFPVFYGALTAGGFVGALDDVPNLVHIYCPARRWVSSYDDFAIEIMNNDTEAIDQFGYTAAGDTDTAAILSWLSGSSGLIRTVPDQILGDHVTQTTKANMPLFVASGQNGRAVGRYSGSQWLQVAFSALSQPYNEYVVAKANNTNVQMFLTDGDDTGHRILLFHTNTARRAFNSGATLIAPQVSDTLWNIWTVLFNTTASQLWINGTSQTTGNTGTHNADGITIGASPSGANGWQGDIGPVILADPNHDTTARQAVEAAINSYYAIF